MRKNMSIRTLKRIFCLTFALFLFTSNFSFAFASFIYDSSIHTEEDFRSSKHHGIKMAKLGEMENFNLYGETLNNIDTIDLNRLTKKSFTVFNTSDSYTRMFYTIGEMEWNNSNNTLGYDRIIKIDGVEYNTNIIKEEIEFTDLIFKVRHSIDGKFSYTGEYTLSPVAQQSGNSSIMKVNIEGYVSDYYYAHANFNENYQLYLGLDLIADNNNIKIDIDDQIQKKPYVNKSPDYSNEDIGKITLHFIAPILTAELINEQNSPTPMKVTAAAVVSIALATTGSIALSSVSSSADDDCSKS